MSRNSSSTSASWGTFFTISPRRKAKDIAKKIEAELEYPGQIKVNVIREFRSVEYAK